MPAILQPVASRMPTGYAVPTMAKKKQPESPQEPTLEGETFGQKLARLREAKGITKFRLAKEAGLDHAYIGRLEQNKMEPSFRTVCRIAKVLGVDLNDLRPEGFDDPDQKS